MALKVVESSWLPASGGNEEAAAGSPSASTVQRALSGHQVSSAVLPDSLVDRPRAVEGHRHRALPARCRPGASPGAGVVPACFRFLAPGIGIAPLAMIQAKATWLGVRSPYASPIRRSTATTLSTSTMGCAEKSRALGGGLAADTFQSADLGRWANRRAGSRPSSRQHSSRPTFSGLVRSSENSIWLVARRRPRLRSAASIDLVSFTESFETPTASISPSAWARPAHWRARRASAGIGPWIW